MKTDLMIASPKKDRAASWKRGLKGLVKVSVITDTLAIICDDVERIEPEISLVDSDLLELDSPNGVARLTTLCIKTKVIILSGAISEDMEWELLKAGVRGSCRREISSDLLKRVVLAVRQGELWIRRTITSRLINELAKMALQNRAHQTSHELLKKLTQREYDIAVHVGNGESNKHIAQSCEITERTVKAHLSEVFHKLGVTDRLKLALIISANRSHSA